MRISIALFVAFAALAGCDDAAGPPRDANAAAPGGKADSFGETGRYEVLLTRPHCDVCSADDKAYLKAHSPLVKRIIELIDGAEHTVDVSQFTFSVREIEAALLRAHERGVSVRLAINVAQKHGDTVAKRLADAGLDVHFVEGRPAAREGGYAGLLHAKFMIVDGATLLTGSNNWSSTGTTINEENTIVAHGGTETPLIGGFACDFEAIWAGDLDGAASCGRDGQFAFTPGGGAVALLRDNIRAATTSVDVLMHHFVFDSLVKVVAQAAERGVRVRVIVNAADRQEVTGRYWDRLEAAGGQVRFKQSNAEAYQLMHHKLAIVDGRVLLNGSGNWSGSAFFNNYENYVRYEDPAVVRPFARMFARLWTWSLTGESLDAGTTAARQHAAQTRIFFGNLHAHHHKMGPDGRRWDDGKLLRKYDDGETYDVSSEVPNGDGARYAYEYARDRGEMDFLVLSPHVVDDRPGDPMDLPSMRPEGYQAMRDAAFDVNKASGGAFLALAGMEWSTNSTGNHVNIFGCPTLAKVERGRFDLLYEDYLPACAKAGGRAILQLNHPRTFRRQTESLKGNWDQIFGVDLREIPKSGQRRVKFNDYGLDDYGPVKDLLAGWIQGEALPDEAAVAQSLEAVRQASAPYARLMEVTVARGTEIGHENHQNPDLSEDEQGQIYRYTRVDPDWNYYLLHGFRLSPTAPHDNHLANWGTGHSSRTGVLAASLDQTAFLDALDAGATFASEDEDLEIRLYAGGRVPMGGQLGTTADRVPLELFLSDPDFEGPFEVVLFQGTVGGEAVKPVQQFDSVAGDTWQQIALDLPEPGVHFVYAQIHEVEGDRMAWSAPIWVERLR